VLAGAPGVGHYCAGEHAFPSLTVHSYRVLAGALDVGHYRRQHAFPAPAGSRVLVCRSPV